MEEVLNIEESRELSYDEYTKNPLRTRYEELRRICGDLAQNGSRSVEHYNLLKTLLKDAQKQLAALDIAPSIDVDILAPKGNKIMSPAKKKRRGRPRTERLQSTVKKMQKKKMKVVQNVNTINVDEVVATQLSQVGDTIDITEEPDYSKPFSFTSLLFQQTDAIFNTPWSEDNNNG